MKPFQVQAGRGLLLAVTLLAGPVMASAQGLAAGDEVRTYGPSKTFLTLGPFNFAPADSTVTYSLFSVGFGSVRGLVRTNATGNTFFVAPVNLPEGAVVTEMEVVFCDSSASKLFTSNLAGYPRMASLGASLNGPSSTGVEAPGCVDRTTVFGTPLQIDNNNNVYEVSINLGGAGTAGDTTIVFGSLRLGYHLQPSVAPGLATFNDVPTGHPFFPYIEALVAAGITTGCSVSPPLFCPDNVVTRAQMAKFFGLALGLQFAP